MTAGEGLAPNEAAGLPDAPEPVGDVAVYATGGRVVLLPAGTVVVPLGELAARDASADYPPLMCDWGCGRVATTLAYTGMNNQAPSCGEHGGAPRLPLAPAPATRAPRCHCGHNGGPLPATGVWWSWHRPGCPEMASVTQAVESGSRCRCGQNGEPLPMASGWQHKDDCQEFVSTLSSDPATLPSAEDFVARFPRLRPERQLDVAQRWVELVERASLSAFLVDPETDQKLLGEFIYTYLGRRSALGLGLLGCYALAGALLQEFGGKAEPPSAPTVPRSLVESHEPDPVAVIHQETERRLRGGAADDA